jgi:hypothetical protein
MEGASAEENQEVVDTYLDTCSGESMMMMMMMMMMNKKKKKKVISP